MSVFDSNEASRLLAADPGEVSSLAAAFHRVSNQARQAAAGLRGAESDARWTGGAADAFRSKLGKLPGDLDKIQQSYGEVAHALDAYESQLAPLRSRFVALQSRYESLQHSLSGAQGQLQSAQGKLSSAQKAPNAKPNSPAVQNAHDAVQSAHAAVGRLQGELSGVESQAGQVLSEFTTHRSQARSWVSGAAGIAPVHHWWQSALGAVGNFMSATGHVLAHLAVGVYDAATSLPGDVAAVLSHPTNLEDWAKLGEDAGTVAGAVALVAAVVVFPADALGLDAAVGVIETVGDGAEAVGMYAGYEKTAADAGLVAEGKKSMGDLAFDAAGDVAGHLDVPGLKGADADVEHFGAKSGALEQYGLNRALGASPTQAYRALSGEQRSVITSSVRQLGDPGRLSYMRSSTAEALETAERSKMRLNLANNVVHTAYDKSSEALKEAVVTEPTDGGEG